MKKITSYNIGKIYQILSLEDGFIYPEKSNVNTHWVDYQELFMLLRIKNSRSGLLAKVLTQKGFVLDVMIDNDTEYLEEVIC